MSLRFNKLSAIGIGYGWGGILRLWLNNNLISINTMLNIAQAVKTEARRCITGVSFAFVLFIVTAWGGSRKPQAQISSSLTPQTLIVNVTTVRSLELNRQLRLPGELQAWRDTALAGE